MRTIIGCLLAVALLSSQSGCALLTKQPPAPPSEEVRANLGTIGIVSSTASPELAVPEITAPNQSSVELGKVAERGMLGTAIGGLAGMLIGGAVGAAVCAPALFAAPLCAAAGGIYGLAGGSATRLLIGGASGYLTKNETQATADFSSITRDAIIANAKEALTRAHPREEIRDQVYKSLQTQTTASATLLAADVTAERAQDADFLKLRDSGVETVLELTLTKIGLTGDRVSLPSSPATPYLTVRSRLIRASDNEMLYTNSYDHQGRSRTVKEWNEVEPWQQFLSESAPPLADQIVRHLFLTPPATDWMETTKSALPKLSNTVSPWFRTPSAGKTDESESAQNVAASKVEARDETKEEGNLKPIAENQTAGIGWLFNSIKERLGIKAD